MKIRRRICLIAGLLATAGLSLLMTGCAGGFFYTTEPGGYTAPVVTSSCCGQQYYANRCPNNYYVNCCYSARYACWNGVYNYTVDNY